jgi:ABC-2 type transport system permease protein
MTPIHHDHSADTAVAAMAALPHVDEAAAGAGSAVHAPFRSDRTLPIRVELSRQLHRRRTQIALGFMVLLPLILATAFAVGSDDAGPSTSSFIDLAQSSTANFVMVTLFFSSSFLLIVVVSLFFGDTVASEASWSSLKYLLAMPVPRLRLLRQKLVGAAILSLSAIAILVAVAALVGLIAYGAGPLTTPTGVTFTGGETWARVALAVGSMSGQLAWVAGLAFLMTVATDVPLGAVGTAVLLSIVSQILDQVTALGDLRDWLPTHFSFAWTGAMVDPVSWFDISRGAFQSVAYAAVFVTAAFVVFRRKDITS